MITADWTHGAAPQIGDIVCRLGDAGHWQLVDDSPGVMELAADLSGCQWQRGVVVSVNESVNPPRVGIGPEG